MTWPRDAEGPEPPSGSSPRGEDADHGGPRRRRDSDLSLVDQRTEAPPAVPVEIAATPELRLALQRQAVEVAARFFAGEQSGPRPGGREADYIAPLLTAAAETIRRLERAAS